MVPQFGANQAINQQTYHDCAQPFMLTSFVRAGFAVVVGCRWGVCAFSTPRLNIQYIIC